MSIVKDESFLILTSTDISHFCGHLPSVKMSCYISNGSSGFEYTKHMD